MTQPVLHLGDCFEVLQTLKAESVDACVTDPPYHLTANKKGGTGEASLNLNSPAGRARISTGFMGKAWDGGNTAFRVELWEAVYRVLKPGAHLLAFSGTRTYHRMVCAIEDAGFEIRDQIGWLYGSGFPKSLDVSKAIDKAAGAEREVVRTETRYNEPSGIVNAGRGADARELIERNITAPATEAAKQWDGWGTALKPAWEPIVVARKPFPGRTVAQNVLEHGVGGINVDGCRVGTTVETWPASRSFTSGISSGYTEGKEKGPTQDTGTAPPGRFPANVIHDGSDEVLAEFAKYGEGKSGVAVQRNGGGQSIWGAQNTMGSRDDAGFGDTGTAARFFYAAKSSKDDRNDGLWDYEHTDAAEMVDREPGSDGMNSPRAGAGRTSGARNFHPTCKPTTLMRYLVRLVTPKGGLVLDPFAGSGTTLIAAYREDCRAIGIELDPDYFKMANHRIDKATAQMRLDL